MTIKVTVFHVASKEIEIEVEVPDSLQSATSENLERDAIRDFYCQKEREKKS